MWRRNGVPRAGGVSTSAIWRSCFGVRRSSLEARTRLRAFWDWILRLRLLPTLDMSEQRLAQFTATVLELRLQMIFGYPSALALLAAIPRMLGRIFCAMVSAWHS